MTSLAWMPVFYILAIAANVFACCWASPYCASCATSKGAPTPLLYTGMQVGVAFAVTTIAYMGSVYMLNRFITTLCLGVAGVVAMTITQAVICRWDDENGQAPDRRANRCSLGFKEWTLLARIIQVLGMGVLVYCSYALYYGPLHWPWLICHFILSAFLFATSAGCAIYAARTYDMRGTVAESVTSKPTASRGHTSDSAIEEADSNTGDETFVFSKADQPVSMDDGGDVSGGQRGAKCVTIGSILRRLAFLEMVSSVSWGLFLVHEITSSTYPQMCGYTAIDDTRPHPLATWLAICYVPSSISFIIFSAPIGTGRYGKGRCRTGRAQCCPCDKPRELANKYN